MNNKIITVLSLFVILNPVFASSYKTAFLKKRVKGFQRKACQNQDDPDSLFPITNCDFFHDDDDVIDGLVSILYTNPKKTNFEKFDLNDYNFIQRIYFNEQNFDSLKKGDIITLKLTDSKSFTANDIGKKKALFTYSYYNYFQRPILNDDGDLFSTGYLFSQAFINKKIGKLKVIKNNDKVLKLAYRIKIKSTNRTDAKNTCFDYDPSPNASLTCSRRLYESFRGTTQEVVQRKPFKLSGVITINKKNN